MTLNYTSITIKNSFHSGGSAHQDRNRCQYWIESDDGEKYLAFKERGSLLRNLPIGTRLKIGWVLDNSSYKAINSRRKVIQWFKVLETPSKESFITELGSILTSSIDAEYKKLESIISGIK